MAEDDKPPGKDFVVMTGPPDEDGWTPCVRHRPDHSITPGAVRPVKDGETFEGELIQVKGGDGPAVEVETVWPEPTGHKGPAMVNSKAYGAGWDRIFGGRQKVGEA